MGRRRLIKHGGAPEQVLRNILTDDILFFNILPRLPAKCVGRFMCVSRQWHSFLTTPAFKKLHLRHQNHRHKLLLLSTATPPYMFRTIDCETPKDDGLNTSNRPCPFPTEVEVGSRVYMSIVAYLHGLVCISRSRYINYFDRESNYIDLILWNPVTNEYKTLCNVPSSDGCGAYGLYYSTPEDDYRLVCVTPRHDHHQNVYIYSLKSDSWRNVELESTKMSNSSNCESHFLSRGILLNEKLYFLKGKSVDRGESSFIVVIFDTKTEKTSEIATPTFKERNDYCKGLMVVKGSIHFRVAFEDSEEKFHRIELWSMNENIGDNIWRKMVSYSPPKEARFSWNDTLLHIMRNGDWLMYRHHRYVYQRDIKKDTINIICPAEGVSINQGWEYMETLVSPNQYIIN